MQVVIGLGLMNIAGTTARDTGHLDELDLQLLGQVRDLLGDLLDRKLHRSQHHKQRVPHSDS